jgi:amidophosphoribosyltransferase
MSKLGDFIAFRAAVELLKDRGQSNLIDDVYKTCMEMQANGTLDKENMVRHIYKPFTPEDISAKIAELITPKDVGLPVELIFQTIEDLHASCPTNKGDWYFTGNYPTKGGNRVCNKAFINYYEGKNVRGY